MIYEMRTYDLKSRTQAEVVKRFGEAYEKRKALSPLAAFWTTEIGPLNQIIHVWPYKDLAERTAVRAEAVKQGIWPPKIAEFVVNMRSEIYVPFGFSPAFPTGDVGPYFEMRTYTTHPGKLDALNKRFRDHTNRLFKKHGIDMVGYWTPAEGEHAKDQLVYILAYPNH